MLVASFPIPVAAKLLECNYKPFYCHVSDSTLTQWHAMVGTVYLCLNKLGTWRLQGDNVTHLLLVSKSAEPKIFPLKSAIPVASDVNNCLLVVWMLFGTRFRISATLCVVFSVAANVVHGLHSWDHLQLQAQSDQHML